LHLSRSIDFQTQGEDVQAASELERAVEIGLHNAEAYFNLGLLLHSSESDKAVTYLQQSVKHPDFSLASYLLLAQFHQQHGAIKEAANEYLQALALADSESVKPSQKDELKQLYEPIVESQTQETDESSLKGLCEAISKQLLRKDWRAFLKTARQQLPQPPPNSPPLPLATLLIETRGGEVVESLLAIRKLTADGYYRSAMEEAFYAISSAPTYLPLHAQMAEILAKEGRIQDAVDKFMLAAELYNLRGETGQAIQLLSRVSKIAPMDLSIRSKLIEWYSLQGKVTESLQQYIELGDIYYRLAELDMARQTYLAGLKVAQESKSNRSQVIQFLNKVGDIDTQRFDWRNAIRIYEQLRTLQPEEASYRMKLMDLNFRVGQTSTAIAEMDGYLTILSNTGRLNEAVKFCKDLLTDHPDQNEIRMRYGELLYQTAARDEALGELEKPCRGSS